MAKVKYLSKLWLPENAIFVEDTFDHGGEKLVTTSLDKMFEEIKKYYSFGNDKRNKVSKYIKIGIYNLDATNIAPKQSMTFRESKDILCKYAYYRCIYLSPNLTEVYSEFFHLDFDDEHDCGFECRYDYGLMYGKYTKYNFGTKVYSSYIPKEELMLDGYVNNAIWQQDEIYAGGGDIYIHYNVHYDKDKEYPDQYEDGCVPVSTMRIIKEANENDD